MPSPLRYFTALIPSLVSGHLTTTLGATCTSSLPSFTMPSKSVATTSRLTSPGTTLQISSVSGALHPDRGPGAHRLEHLGISQHAAKHVDRARGPDLVPPARRRRPVEDAERGPRRPVGEVPRLHHLARILALGLHRNAEVDLVAPCLPGDAEGQGLPDRGGGLRIAQHGVRGHLAHRDADLPVSHGLAA